MTVRLKAVHEALRALSEEALNVLHLSLKTNPQVDPREFRGVTDRGRSGGYSYTTAERPNWQMFVGSRRDLFSGSKGYERATAALTADPIIRGQLKVGIGTPAWVTSLSAESCIHQFLAQLLQEAGTVSFSAAAFDGVYAGFEEYFCSPHFAVRAIAPLFWFWSESEAIQLDAGLRIVPLTAADHDHMLTRMANFEMVPRPHGAHHPQFCLELLWSIPKHVGNKPVDPHLKTSVSDAKRRFAEVLSAFRLFQPGAVCYASIEVEHVGWCPHPGPFRQDTGVGTAEQGELYELSGECADEFVAFWKWLDSRMATASPQAKSALRRLNYAYEKSALQDRLIDYVIGLEALLLGEGDNQELSYRLALRGAVLLEKEGIARAEVFRRLRRTYVVRSKVVHGKDLSEIAKKDRTIFPNQVVANAEQDLRAAIVAALKLGETTRNIDLTDYLDDIILRTERE